MKPGARILSYLDFGKIWEQSQSSPFVQLDSNRPISDRYPTSWSVHRGHHFFIWVKVAKSVMNMREQYAMRNNIKEGPPPYPTHSTSRIRSLPSVKQGISSTLTSRAVGRMFIPRALRLRHLFGATSPYPTRSSPAAHFGSLPARTAASTSVKNNRDTDREGGAGRCVAGLQTNEANQSISSKVGEHVSIEQQLQQSDQRRARQVPNSTGGKKQHTTRNIATKLWSASEVGQPGCADDKKDVAKSTGSRTMPSPPQHSSDALSTSPPTSSNTARRGKHHHRHRCAGTGTESNTRLIISQAVDNGSICGSIDTQQMTGAQPQSHNSPGQRRSHQRSSTIGTSLDDSSPDVKQVPSGAPCDIAHKFRRGIRSLQRLQHHARDAQLSTSRASGSSDAHRSMSNRRSMHKSELNMQQNGELPPRRSAGDFDSGRARNNGDSPSGHSAGCALM